MAASRLSIRSSDRLQAELGHKSAELTLNRYGHLYRDDLDALERPRPGA
jgi:hypothetical protein